MSFTDFCSVPLIIACLFASWGGAPPVARAFDLSDSRLMNVATCRYALSDGDHDDTRAILMFADRRLVHDTANGRKLAHPAAYSGLMAGQNNLEEQILENQDFGALFGKYTVQPSGAWAFRGRLHDGKVVTLERSEKPLNPSGRNRYFESRLTDEAGKVFWAYCE